MFSKVADRSLAMQTPHWEVEDTGIMCRGGSKWWGILFPAKDLFIPGYKVGGEA